jgi:hypothetical protein
MSERDREHRFTPTTLFITGSLLVWMANFVVVYVIAALACARGFADMRLAGLPIVPVATTACSVAAAVVTFVLLRRGARELRDRAGSDHSRFLGFVALTTSVLALIALVLVALPALLTGACQR